MWRVRNNAGWLGLGRGWLAPGVLLEDEEFFLTTTLGNRIGGSFAEGEAEVGGTEEAEDLGNVDGEGRAAGAVVEGKGEVDVEAARFKEAVDQLGIFATTGRVDGAEAGVFEQIVEGVIEGMGEGEDVGADDFDRGAVLGEAMHFADGGGRKIDSGDLEAVAGEEAGVVATTGAEDDEFAGRVEVATEKAGKDGGGAAQVPTVGAVLVIGFPLVGGVNVIGHRLYCSLKNDGRQGDGLVGMNLMHFDCLVH